jgi:peroxiredoxin Q/BCP
MSLHVTITQADTGSRLCNSGVWKLKRLYGKESYGVERSTFLITQEGNLAHVWRKVKVSGHVDDVTQTLKTLKQQ